MFDEREPIPSSIERDVCPVCKGSMAYAWTEMFHFQRKIVAKPRIWQKDWYACGKCGYLRAWFPRENLKELKELYKSGKYPPSDKILGEI